MSKYSLGVENSNDFGQMCRFIGQDLDENPFYGDNNSDHFNWIKGWWVAHEKLNDGRFQGLTAPVKKVFDINLVQALGLFARAEMYEMSAEQIQTYNAHDLDKPLIGFVIPNIVLILDVDAGLLAVTDDPFGREKWNCFNISLNKM